MPLIASRSGSAPPEYIVFTPGAGQFISFTSDAVALDFVRQITGDRAATLADIPPVSSAFFDGQLKTMSAGYRSGFTQAFREALGQAQQNVAISNFDELPPIAVDVPAVQVDFPPMSISLTGGTEPATSARD